MAPPEQTDVALFTISPKSYANLGIPSVVNHLFNILTSAESSIPSEVSFTVTFSIKAFCLLVAFVLFVTQMKWCLESNKNLFYI